jgi:hypothetical protein
MAVPTGLALHLLFVFAFFPFALDLAAICGAKLKLATARFGPSIITAPMAIPSFPRIGGSGAGEDYQCRRRYCGAN